MWNLPGPGIKPMSTTLQGGFFFGLFIYVCVCIGCIYTCIYVNIYMRVLAVLGLGCYSGFSVAVASRGYSPVAVQTLLTVVASLISEFRLQGARDSIVAARGLS